MEDLPPPLQEPFDALRERGYSDAHVGNDRPGGPDRIRLVDGDMSVRATRRADAWVLELNCRAWGGEWFPAAVVRAAFDHTSASGPDDQVELADFVSENLDTRLGASPPSADLKQDLIRLEALRTTSQRRLPE